MSNNYLYSHFTNLIYPIYVSSDIPENPCTQVRVIRVPLNNE